MSLFQNEDNKGSPLLWCAPMAEITDSAFRVMAFGGGADLCTTEMVSAAGLVRDSKNTAPLLVKLPEERGRTWVQLYGSVPSEMEEAARILADSGRFEGIDINAGCPAPKVLRCGAGAALIENEVLYSKIVAATVRGAGNIPVSVKTRIGSSKPRLSSPRYAKIAEDAGAVAFAVHGRWTACRHSGPVDFDAMAETVAAVSIPVFCNGGIRDEASALETLSRTGCAGLMIGRGAVGNPWIWGRIKGAFASGKAAQKPIAGGRGEVPLEEVLDTLRTHLRLTIALKNLVRKTCPATGFDPDFAALADFRRHGFVYFRGRSGASALRAAMARVNSVDALLTEISCIFTKNKA